MKLKHGIIILLLIASYSILWADVIELHNGNVYLGSSSTVENRIILDSFGEKKIIQPQDILHNEKTTQSIAKKTVQVKLQDDSIIKGNIKNYDDDIGLLLNTNFGTITVPSKGIKEIINIEQRNLYQGIPLQIGLNGGFYSPLGDFKKDFGTSYFLGAFIETNTYLVRGLYIGADLNFMAMDYTADPDVSYSLYSFRAYAMYRILELRLSKTFINKFIPFFLAGGGLAYTTVDDNRSGTAVAERNEISPTMTFGIGVDTALTENVNLRLQGGMLFLPQGGFYSAYYINAGLTYGL